MNRFTRFRFQPVVPYGKNGRFVTNSKAHWDIARQIATDGTVLLKNDGTLPLSQGAKVCLFGLGAGEFLFGGGGSGRVFTQRNVTLADGLQAAADQGKIAFFAPLVAFYTQQIDTVLEEGRKICSTAADLNKWRSLNPMKLPVLPEELYAQAKEFGDVAIFCVSRHSSEGDTFGDRSGEKGDFYLWDEEQALLDRLTKDFSKVVVVLNTCGSVSVTEYKDNPNVGAILYSMYGGGVAGEALTALLLGEAYPSGHLQHTLANRLEDHYTTAGYREGENYVNYTEDIFVGYRYFETFAPEKVAYPFGFGLGYTTFDVHTVSAVLEKNTVKLEVQVTNTGVYPGKEVVQVYLEAPQGKLGKAKKVLCAFQKTRQLQPKETATLKLHFDIRQFASFDDLGKVCKTAFVLEQGNYIVHVGNNVRDTERVFDFTLAEDIVCKKCKPFMAPVKLSERLTANGTMEKLPQPEPVKCPIRGYKLKAEKPEKDTRFAAALEAGRFEEFLASLTDEDIAKMLYGHAMMNVSSTNGIGIPPRYEVDDNKFIPLVPTADGPAGLRIRAGRGVNPTFFPCATVIAQTWDPSLAKKMGVCVARETKENNIGIWLAPGMNIHRNPLCGRNFEYYSEDPLTTGLFATATVQGVQSEKIAATVKHFCCNNRELNRRIADSRVSQRALREIYLRGFEIVVKKADPMALMTSYNPVNGVQMSANPEALNGILRGEWGYDGVVMTDWRTLSNLEDEVHAGSDVKMPQKVTHFYEKAPEVCDPEQMLKDGTLDRGAALNAVRRILKMMSKMD